MVMLNIFKDICEVSCPNLQKPLAVRGRSEPRTLKRMEEQYKKFQGKARGIWQMLKTIWMWSGLLQHSYCLPIFHVLSKVPPPKLDVYCQDEEQQHKEVTLTHTGYSISQGITNAITNCPTSSSWRESVLQYCSLHIYWETSRKKSRKSQPPWRKWKHISILP